MTSVDLNTTKGAAGAIWTSTRALGAALLSASLVSGCATVQSNPKPASNALDANSAGLNYFLPKKLVKLTISRETIDLAKLKKTHDAASAAWKAAAETQSEKEADAEHQQGLLDQMAADAEARSDQVKASEKANAELTLANSDLADAHTALTKAAESYFSALSAGQKDGCAYKAKLELQPAQADINHRFIAELRHNWLRDDTIKLAVNPAGLLTSANIVAVDRTGDILVDLAGAVAGTGSAGEKSMIRSSINLAIKACDEPKSMTLIFDPTDPLAIKDVAERLDKANYPYRVGTGSYVPYREGIEADRETAREIYKQRRGAIFYRSPVPVPLVLERQVGETWHIVDAAMVQLPQAGPISYIPANASAFVKTVDDVVFVDGAIASWSPDRPSEALEIVRLPVKVASAIISVPAQILSLRVDYSSKAKALADQQTDQMAATQTLSVLRKCLNDATAAQSDGLACLPTP